MPTKEFTYHYHANALGLGGVLKNERGVIPVPSLASVVLADSGGHSADEISDYDQDGVKFSQARCEVTGHELAPNTFTTRSEVSITKLNLFDRVTAAHLQMSMRSTREATGGITTDSDPDKAIFSMEWTIFGLVIDGVEVLPQFDQELAGWPTYALFDSGQARRLSVPPMSLTDPGATQSIRTSFVQALNYAPAPIGPSQGFRLPVTNFGTIHFGELVVKPGNRRANLLRIDFDSMLRVADGVPTTRRVISDAALQNPAVAADMVMGQSPSSGNMTLLSLAGNGVPSWP
jgi:hypothetical protein